MYKIKPVFLYSSLIWDRWKYWNKYFTLYFNHEVTQEDFRPCLGRDLHFWIHEIESHAENKITRIRGEINDIERHFALDVRQNMSRFSIGMAVQENLGNSIVIIYLFYCLYDPNKLFVNCSLSFFSCFCFENRFALTAKEFAPSSFFTYCDDEKNMNNFIIVLFVTLRPKWLYKGGKERLILNTARATYICFDFKNFKLKFFAQVIFESLFRINFSVR